MKNLKFIQSKIKYENIQKFLSSAISLFKLDDLELDSDRLELYSTYTSSDDGGYYIYVGHKLNKFYFCKYEINLHKIFISDYKISPKFSLCYILNKPQIKFNAKVIFCNNVQIYPNNNVEQSNFILKKFYSASQLCNDLKKVIITVSNKTNVILDFSLNFNK